MGASTVSLRDTSVQELTGIQPHPIIICPDAYNQCVTERASAIIMIAKLVGRANKTLQEDALAWFRYTAPYSSLTIDNNVRT